MWSLCFSPFRARCGRRGCRSAMVAVGLLLALATSVHAQVWQHQGQPPQLVELYTSQGCSSCPPADARLNALLQRAELWRELVPMAFHVDYWDYLGWKDPFAQSAFSQRQRALQRQGRLRSVYTPAWVVDGGEWRGFFRGQALPDPRPRRGGLLRAELQGQRLQLQFQARSQAVANRDLTAHLVVLAFDQASRVAAGENRGRYLQHQFVVVEKQQASAGESWQFELQRPLRGRQALVVWLTSPQQREPLQVVGGWIDAAPAIKKAPSTSG